MLCPVNPAQNCSFMEAIFSLNNNQTFIASFTLRAGGVSGTVVLLCLGCSFQLCPPFEKGYETKKNLLFECIFIVIYHLINWSDTTPVLLSPALWFNSVAVKAAIMRCTLKSYDAVNTVTEHCCESHGFEIRLLFWDPSKQCKNSITVRIRFARLDVTSDGIMSRCVSWEVQLGSRACAMVSCDRERFSGRAGSISLSEMTRSSCKKRQQMTSD